MYTQEERSSEMQKKLREGLESLARASEDDIVRLNQALIKIHGAMEDFLRVELGIKAPHLRQQVEDPRQTQWRDLITYAKQYLGFSYQDGNIVSAANAYRQEVAHGGNYAGSRAELVRYAEFVHRRIFPTKLLPDLTYSVAARPSTTSSVATSSTPTAYPKSTIPAPARPAYTSDPSKPWYRSTIFLFLSFFLMPPLWAWLILTDRKQGGFARLVAGAVLMFVFFCVVGVLYSWGFFSETPAAADQPPILESPQMLDSPSDATISSPTQSPANPGTTEGCTIAWMEYPSNLGAKSRAMVWEEIVVFRVQGSGMTHRDFYDQVVERNPELIADGYEFKQGKRYLLPECR